MVNYRLYYFNDEGHICAVEELTCADDAEAIRVFECCASDRPMELWHLLRRIKTYSPAQAPGAARAR
jgi:hypothetical protein